MTILKTSDKLQEKCAVFGVFATSQVAARLSFYGLCALQHRGQESSGIATSDGEAIFTHNDSGLVTSVYREEDLEKLPGHIAIGHNRYSTSGGRLKRFNQPFIHKKHGVALAHNGNLPDMSELKAYLSQRKVSTRYLNDTGMMLAAICEKLDDGLTPEEAIRDCYALFTGAFSCVLLTKDKLITFRDPCGIRPLSLGRQVDGTYVVASETCALDTVSAQFIREVRPGEILSINKDGLQSNRMKKTTQRLDIFEFIYFARPDSNMLGKNVNEVRLAFGREMAAEHKIDADVVIPVPDSSISAALGYAKASGIPFEMSLIKNRYIHRTFIHPTAAMRTRDLTMKLNPIVESIRGRRIILVDDSIVRGTTMRKVVSMLREAGATEVHLLISSPPVLYPDFYGINTPSQNELIAANMPISGIRDYVGANSLHFLSYDGMVRATSLPENVFSASCFNGDYPVSIGERAAEIRPIEHREYATVSLGQKTVVMKKPRVALFASGNGSTAEALVRDLVKFNLGFEVTLLIGNNPNAKVFERIANLNKELNLHIRPLVINSKTRLPAENETVIPGQQTEVEQDFILQVLQEHEIDLVLLLGYMKQMGPRIVEAYGWQSQFDSVYEARMINTHPGLLPVTKGHHGVGVQEYVLQQGHHQAGQSLHTVADGYDEGPVIFEHHVPIEEDDTAETLFERVQTAEKSNIAKDVAQFIVSQQQFKKEAR